MALRGLAYSVRMSAYNTDGERVSGIASTITATLWADGTTTVLSGTITEIGTTGVYIVPLTASQMEAYNLCITAVSSTAGITFDPVYLDTDAGRVDTNVGSRLATSGYTSPPTVNEIQNGLAKTSEIPSVPTVSEIQNGLAKTSEIPTVTAIQTGLAKTSELPSVPTVNEIQNGLAKTSEIPSISEISASVWSSETRTLTTGGTDFPTVSDIADGVWTRSSRLITGGAPTANSIASAVWTNTERTLTDTPTYNGPTTTEIADAVGSVDLTALPNADVGSLKTLALLQTNTGMTSERLTVYETDGTEHTHYDVTTDPDTGIQSVRITGGNQ